MAERATLRLCLVPLLGLLGLLGLGAGPAWGCDANNQHSFGVSPGCGDMRISGPSAPGNVAPDFFQAGGHPYELISAIRFNAPAEAGSVNGPYWPPEPVKSMRLGLPAGLVANPAAIPACTMEQLRGVSESATCSPDSQVGVMTLYTILLGSAPETLGVPLFRVVAPEGVPARFGINLLGSTSLLDAELSPEGGFSMGFSDMTAALQVNGFEVALWGTPADPAHTPERACPGRPPPTPGLFGVTGPSCAAGVPPRAFLRLPTSCTAPATVPLEVDSWTHPGVFEHGSISVHRSPGLLGDPAAGGAYPAAYPGLPPAQWGAPQAFTGCERTPFAPSLAVSLASRSADGPTGLDIEISQPQRGLDDPEALAEADLEGGTVKLPPELILNPSVANGLTACTPEQVDLDSSDAARCPDSSKLGTVELASPLLPTPLTGSIFSAQPDAGAAGAGLPTYIVAGDDGSSLKLRSEVRVDRADGSMTASFEDLPQVPISRLKMHFFGGERAPFVTPSTCGSYTVSGRFTPRSGTGAVSSNDSFEIASGLGGGSCLGSLRDRPFRPGFIAGTTNAFAGANGALTVKMTRGDGEQEPTSFEMSLPPGLTASMRGVTRCPDASLATAEGRKGAAELESPSCPASSLTGTVSATVGAGSEPLALPGGRAYLAGPHDGSRVSIAIVLPAVVGPLDLGTVVLRLPLTVDPVDGHLTMASAFPALREGIRLNLRKLVIKIDRPDFIVNPTSCRRTSIDGRIGGDSGATAVVSTPFQMVGCDALGFAPRLRMKVLGGREATRHRSHPELRTTLRARRGDANFKRAAISFSDSAQLDPAHMRGICSRAQFAAEDCPRDSIYGRAKIAGPLFDEPLTGPVYLRVSKGKLPDLVAAPRGGEFDFNLVAKVGFADGRLRVVLPSLPDVPIGKLTLTTWGGKRGLFVNNRSLCGSPSYVTVEMRAQNGKSADREPKLEVPCGR